MDFLNATQAAASNAADKSTIKAAEQFEGLLIKHMLQQMRKSLREIASDDSAAKDPVNDDMLDLADGFVADAMASQHAFGVADALLKQLLPDRSLKPAAAPVASSP